MLADRAEHFYFVTFVFCVFLWKSFNSVSKMKHYIYSYLKKEYLVMLLAEVRRACETNAGIGGFFVVFGPIGLHVHPLIDAYDVIIAVIL